MTEIEKSARQGAGDGISNDEGVRCLDDDEVLGFLDRHLAGARLRAIERHLDDCEGCRRLVGYVAREEAELSQTVRSPDDKLDPETMVDQFKIDGPIGVGGMGEIYLATDTDLLRPVALKLISRKLIASAEARERLVVEARATARVTHPGVVQIHSIGVYAGRPYLALEHVEGETLKAYLDRGKPKLYEILDLGVQMADALAAAHAEGVLHRDLKPHNAIIARDGRVRLLDFGLAKVLAPVEVEDEDDPDWRDVTRGDPKSVRGTPGYMAPEQWRNDEITSAADVWGLGVVLYEMITGRRPYQESSAISYAVRVCADEPVPAIPEDAGVPPELVTLVERCLAKRPEDRPSAAEVATALRHTASLDVVRLARDLDNAAELWTSGGTPTDTLWEGRALADAERVLLAQPFSMDPRTTRFLSASMEAHDRKQATLRRRLFGAAGIAVAFAAIAGLLAWQTAEKSKIAVAAREQAEAARATALAESAAAAFAGGRTLEARAKLRDALEARDSTLARVLLWRVEDGDAVWSHSLGAGAYDLAITGDGAIVLASQDGTVHLIDADTLESKNLRGLEDQVVEVAASGTSVAAASRGGQIAVWNLASKSRRDLPKAKRVDALAFGPRDTLAIADRNGTITLHTLTGTSEPVTWRAKAGVYDLAFVGGGIYAAEADGRVRVYDMNTKAEADAYVVGDKRVLSVAAQGDYVAAGDAIGRLRVWKSKALVFDATLGGAIQRVVLGSSRVFAAGSGRRVVSWALDGTDRRVVTTHGGGVWGLGLVDDTIVSATVDGELKRSALVRRDAPMTDGGHLDGATAVAFSSDGKFVFSGGYDRRLRVWDGATGRLLDVREGHEGTIYDIEIDGETIATASHDRTARVWRNGGSVALVGHGAGVYGVAIEGDRVYSASADGTVRVWNATSGDEITRHDGHDGVVYAVAARNGRIVSGGKDGTVRKFGAWQGVLHGHEGPVWSVGFHGDDLISGSYDGTLRRWTNDESTIAGRTDHRIYEVAAFGETIAAAGAATSVWLSANGKTSAFVAGRSEVNSVRFSPDGSKIATASDDGTVRVFDAADRRPLWYAPLADGPCTVGWDGEIERDGSPIARWKPASAVTATDSSCYVLADGELRKYDRKGAHLTIGEHVGAVAAHADGALVVFDDEVAVVPEAGARRAIATTASVDGVTAVAMVTEKLVLGWNNGRVELGDVALEGTPSSAVTNLAPGPRDTIAAGFANGTFGLWSAVTGERLHRDRVHGAIVGLEVRDGGLSVVSALGDRRSGPSGLDRPYCDVLQSAWRSIVVTWSEGRAKRAEAPKEHSCKAS